MLTIGMKLSLPIVTKHIIPIAVAMGEGYSPDIKHIVEAHCNTFKLGKGNFRIITFVVIAIVQIFKPF